MNQPDPSPWIPYLKEPLVLIGFAIMLIAGIFKTLLRKNIFRLSKPASERIIKIVVLCSFSLGVLIIALGFRLAAKEHGKTSQVKIIQETKGKQSPAVIGSDVSITYGANEKKGEKSIKAEDDIKKKTTDIPSAEKNISQKTGGNQSPAVVSDGDVTIKYNNK